MKKISIIALLCVCSFVLFSCTGNDTDSTEASDTAETVKATNADSIAPDVNTSVYDDVEIHEGFPTSCLITYDFGTSVMSLIRTDKGVYIRSGDSEMLFIKASNGYSTYAKDKDGVFVLSKDLQNLADGYMNQYISTFSTFCYAHEQNFASMTKGTKVTVCERLCTEYYYTVANEDSRYSYTYAIDDETGICMKYRLNGTEDGESSVHEYTCTEFQLENVSLPKYK